MGAGCSSGAPEPREERARSIAPPPPSAEAPEAARPTYQYDLVILGAGSAGVRAARLAADYGAKVALVEPSLSHGPPHYTAVGGTSVNVGCIPKKLLVHGSAMAETIDNSKFFGWRCPDHPSHDWAAMMANKDAEVSRLNGVFADMLLTAGVDLLVGWGSLLDGHTVAVRNERCWSEEPPNTVTGERVVLAVGSRPAVPDIPGKELCITSNEAFYLQACPAEILIVGGGYVAVEFACIFNNFGAKVTLLHTGEVLLQSFDDDIRRHLEQEMLADGIDIRPSTEVVGVERLPSGWLAATTSEGDSVSAEVVMFATGRVPNTTDLELEHVPVALHPATGAVVVDAHSCTSCPSVYAVGDVTGRRQHTPVALHEAQCLADTLFGGVDRTPCYDWVPTAVFSQPPAAYVGLTTEEAARRYHNVAVYRSVYRPMQHTMTGSNSRGMVKLLVDVATDQVVGAHMCGPDAPEVLQGLAIPLRMGATKALVDATLGLHPSAAEEFVTLRAPAYFVGPGAPAAAPAP
eukprot:EG_transcript_6486